MSNGAPLVNPYLQRRPFGSAHNAEMGRQSQQRVNQTKRAFQLARRGNNNNNNMKRKGDQLTLDGQRAFQSEKDCIVCKAKALQRCLPTATIPKRAHHVLCARNTKTQGRGMLNKASVASEAEEKRLKAHFSQPLSEQEKCSGKHATKEADAAFFSVRDKPTINSTTTDIQSKAVATTTSTAIDFCKAVSTLVSDSSFREKHKAKSPPLAMIAFAGEVVEKVTRANNQSVFDYYFEGMTMVVPPASDATNEPHCHSIVGQKLLLVD